MVNICGSDFLVYAEGWILLHNPQRGIAEVEQNEGKNMTKAQTHSYLKK